MNIIHDFLTTDLEPWIAYSLIGLSCFTSFLTTTLGLGGGAVLLAVMANIFPAAALIPVHGAVQLGSNAGRSILMIRHVSWVPFKRFLAGSLIGVVIGGNIVISLSNNIIQVGVGVFIIWTVLSKPPKWLSDSPMLAGLGSSFLTMFFGATGPFVGSFVRSLKINRLEFSGTLSMLMVAQHALKTITFCVLGFPLLDWLGFITAMILAGFFGTFLGKKVLIKRSDDNF